MAGMIPAYNAPIDLPAVAVTTTATRLLTEAQGNQQGLRGVLIQPVGGIVFLGGKNVTAATGIQYTDGQSILLPHTQGSDLYAITSTGTVNVRVLPFTD